MDQKDFYRELGHNIHVFRKMHHMTQKELAYSIKKSLACISKYEKGDIAIDLYTLKEIGDKLGISIEQLLPNTQAVPPSPSDIGDFPPLFKKTPLYLYWYQGGKQTLVQHVIDLDIHTSKVTCYMEVDHHSDYKACKYMMTGTIFCNGPNTFIYATNLILKEDFIFACFNSADLFDLQMVGFFSCLNRSYHVTSSKCFISHTPISSPDDILSSVLVTREEIAELRSSNFFTFGVHKKKI